MTRLLPTRRLPLTAGLAALTLAAAGCGGAATKSGSAKPAGAQPVAASTVKIADFKFKPKAVQVKVGSKLTFDNVDSAGHTATADASGFDSGPIQQGKKKTVTFSKPGTITYHCAFHPFMKGVVVVK